MLSVLSVCLNNFIVKVFCKVLGKKGDKCCLLNMGFFIGIIMYKLGIIDFFLFKGNLNNFFY